MIAPRWLAARTLSVTLAAGFAGSRRCRLSRSKHGGCAFPCPRCALLAEIPAVLAIARLAPGTPMWRALAASSVSTGTLGRCSFRRVVHAARSGPAAQDRGWAPGGARGAPARPGQRSPGTALEGKRAPAGCDRHRLRALRASKYTCPPTFIAIGQADLSSCRARIQRRAALRQPAFSPGSSPWSPSAPALLREAVVTGAGLLSRPAVRGRRRSRRPRGRGTRGSG